MSAWDIIVSFIISLVSGILCSAFFAYKGNPVRPTIIQFHEKIVVKEYREKIIIKKETRSDSGSSNDMWALIAVIFVAFFLVVTFFAKYRDVIILWGWYIILFGSSIVITSIIISFIRDKRIEFSGIWTFLSWIAIVYVFWKFTNPGLGQDYIDYLSSVKQGKSVEINEFSRFAFVQFLGLVPLIFASLLTFFQSITFMIWPFCYNYKFLHPMLSKITGLYSKYFLGIHAFLILFSYLYCSGLIAGFFSFNGYILK